MKGNKMRAMLAILMPAMLLAGGCEDSQPTQPQQPIVVRSEAQDQLHQLSEMNLKVALRRAIYDSGAACQTVTTAGYVQEHDNLSMWTASCADGGNWAIFVGPDGTAQVRRCENMKELGLPECVIRDPAAPAPEAPSAP
jgi:hypothetical protein